MSTRVHCSVMRAFVALLDLIIYVNVQISCWHYSILFTGILGHVCVYVCVYLCFCMYLHMYIFVHIFTYIGV